MKLERKELEHLARLARIELSAEEKERFSHQFGEILAYVEKLKRLDTKNIEPTTHVLALKNVFRKDIIRPSLSAEEALAGAPRKKRQSFAVPRVIE